MPGLFDFLFGRRPRPRRRKSARRAAVQAAARRLQRRGSRSLQLARGLSHKAAYRAASAKLKGSGFDFRGFTYNARTGRAVCV